MRAVSAFTAAVIFVVAAAAAWFTYAVFGDRARPVRQTSLIVARGSTFRDISGQLAREGVVRNAAVFRLYAKLSGADTDVHAGEFVFQPHQNAAEVLQQLRSGGAQVARWLAVPEGYTAKQIAERLEQDGFGSAERFDDAFMRDTIALYGTRTKNLEGYLFPSTYLIPIGAGPKVVERIMTTEFMAELPPDAAKKARIHGLTVPQVVTLASLVEREAKADDERGLMAGVYYNRLHAGMPLEVDATIEYVLPQHHTVVTYADLAMDSPYNTYKYRGLPPTPIANPGRPSLMAAFNPKPSPYFYYVYKGNGHHAFAKTLAQQNANIAKYLK